MKTSLLKAGLAVCLLLPFTAAAQTPSTLLVVPARQRMIQLAFDMASLRQAEVVSWREASDSANPELNYWTGNEWKPLSLDKFRSGASFARKPQKTLFLGAGAPAVLTEAVPGFARFETFDMDVLVNNLDAFYAFTEPEWRLLSRRYGFVLRDTNARLRQQNRYNEPPPSEPRSRRNPVIFEKNPAPAKVTEPVKTGKKGTPAVKPAAPAKVESEPQTLKPEPIKEKDVFTDSLPPATVTEDAASTPPAAGADKPAPPAVESKPAATPAPSK